MFLETAYNQICDDDDGLGALTPAQQAKVDRWTAAGKTKKITRKTTKWGGGSLPSWGSSGEKPSTIPAPKAPGSDAPVAPGAESAPSGGGMDFLSGEVFGIPILWIVVGVGAFLLLKRR